MSDVIKGLLRSASIVDYITRLDLRDGRSYEGIITIYNEAGGCVRLTSPEDVRFYDLEIKQICGLELVDHKPVEWSL